MMGRLLPSSVRQARGARAALPRSHWAGISALMRRQPATPVRSSRSGRATKVDDAGPGGWMSTCGKRWSSACAVGWR